MVVLLVQTDNFFMATFKLLKVEMLSELLRNIQRFLFPFMVGLVAGLYGLMMMIQIPFVGRKCHTAKRSNMVIE